MTIYKTLLGEDFTRLHPMLQKRYMLPVDRPFYATGVMHKIESGAKWLRPFYALASKTKFLFPESGDDVPFSICNTCRVLPSGELEVLWERTFIFSNRTRHFDAKMTIDPVRNIVKDYLGSPALFYSDLHFTVTREGTLVIRSGVQRFVVSKIECPLPKILEGRVIVEEGFDDKKNVFTIHVSIHNPLIGRLMMYAGEFTQQSK
ncbi:DUF4166 domain-containing protein [Lysinibacillus sp. BPa_S21]|uniref:DUF4166 domain-containing protein n=1 Tax=Lysinibacillus sp. BPa_S21 TaxID=2932478 RepID=UPI0020121B9F|nr:DUF4166 domain-containing protein [Lysinibacillus sp. BPa_S21]MCL1694674.1 DUF4166 domain-containing protein [Lysinibacillus sp. BPa_S21]